METQLLSRLRGPALAPEARFLIVYRRSSGTFVHFCPHIQDLDSIAASIRSSPTVRLALAGVKAFGRLECTLRSSTPCNEHTREMQ